METNLSDVMKLGTEEKIEVWFIPTSQQLYCARVLQEFSCIEDARKYIADNSKKYFLNLEAIHVTTTRHRVV